MKIIYSYFFVAAAAASVSKEEEKSSSINLLLFYSLLSFIIIIYQFNSVLLWHLNMAKRKEEKKRLCNSIYKITLIIKFIFHIIDYNNRIKIYFLFQWKKKKKIKRIKISVY